MPPKIRAKQNWSVSKHNMKPEINHLNQLVTWLIPFVITSPNQTTITFKSGNKAYGLAGSSTPNEFGTGTNSNGISEIALKRKYRQVLYGFFKLLYYYYIVHYVSMLSFFVLQFLISGWRTLYAHTSVRLLQRLSP